MKTKLLRRIAIAVLLFVLYGFLSVTLSFDQAVMVVMGGIALSFVGVAFAFAVSLYRHFRRKGDNITAEDLLLLSLFR